MVWTVKEEVLYDNNAKKHAGGKAREDLSAIFSKCGIKEIAIELPQKERENANFIKKTAAHIAVAREWRKQLEKIPDNDSLILQFPVMNHTLFFGRELKKIKKRKIKVYAFVHDLECLRMSNDNAVGWKMRWRMKKEELDELKLFDGIVVHNHRMKDLMETNLGVDTGKVVELGIFDYLVDNRFKPKEKIKDYNNCIIAGNLKRSKSSYIYKLPQSPDFELYGVNFEGNDNENIHYHGSFLADELPFHLDGGFGLVWDGDSDETCGGAWGKYLRYNNPHKTSLYLACGIPVIIWEEAALADFILEHKAGITVRSLDEIDEAIESMTAEEYKLYKNNAIKLSKLLRDGYYTKAAINNLDLFS